jgi:CHASE2 domain-containing sensor protein
MSGAEIQANAISTLLRGVPLSGVGSAVDIVLIILLGLLPAAVVQSLRARAAMVATIAAAAGALVLAQLLFSAGRLLPVVYPLIALVLSAAGVAAARRAAVTRLR